MPENGRVKPEATHRAKWKYFWFYSSRQGFPEGVYGDVTEVHKVLLGLLRVVRE
jgi:hypothetical protein